jgi:hypothetical protein
VRAQVAVAFRASPSIHPDYTYWSEQWERIRDAELGEVEIKRKREKYLPKMSGHDAGQYQAYLSRAVFFNMVSKTLGALYGTVFRRNPKINGLSDALVKASRKFSKDGMSLHLTAKTTVKEVLAVGRYGLLVDAAPDGSGDPYVACYTAENIIDWAVGDVNGATVLTRVVLRELTFDRTTMSPALHFNARYRVLELEEAEETGQFVYSQSIFKDNRTASNLPGVNDVPDEVIIPTVRGEPLDYIPFIVIGPFTNHPDVQKPPILDIVSLNFSHYQSYAQLEHGRFFTANPVYWVQTGSTSNPNEYWIGPDVVWELGKGEQAGVIEFQGQGLVFLENALTTKEQQVAAIGGRMMPGTSKSAAESDNSLKMKEANEQTLLMNIADTVDEGFTQLLRWWADWMNTPVRSIDAIFFELNRDFLLKDIGAREFRAIHQMYKEGIIPVDVVYEYLSKAEVIPDWMGADEYRKLLDDSKQFPHMVDVLAQMDNFPDAKSFHEFRIMKAQMAVDVAEVTAKPGEPNNPRTSVQASVGSVATPAPPTVTEEG